MTVITIKNRTLFIDDEAIIRRIGGSSLMFKLHKDTSGDVVIVAIKDNLGSKVVIKKRVSVNTPSALKAYSGMDAIIYTEKLRPVPNEAFRVRVIGCVLKGGKEVALNPYFTKTSIVIPQMFVNEYVNMVYKGLGVSFNGTTRTTVSEGFILVNFKDLSDGKAYVDEYRVRECGTGLRSGRLSQLVDYVDSDLTKYIFKGVFEDTLFFEATDERREVHELGEASK